MGWSKQIYFGACLVVKNSGSFDDELHDSIYPMNGNVESPKDDIYYLVPNRTDVSKYGISHDASDEEGSCPVSAEMIAHWRINFIEDFTKEITIAKQKYNSGQVAVAFVTGWV